MKRPNNTDPKILRLPLHVYKRVLYLQLLLGSMETKVFNVDSSHPLKGDSAAKQCFHSQESAVCLCKI